MDARVEFADDATANPLARARALHDLIAAHAPYGDTAHELAPEVVAALHDAGLFRLLIPRRLGGAELPLADYVAVVEAIAQADGSTAWCIAQNSGCSLTAAYLPPEAGMRMFGADPRAVLAWGAGPSGQAIRAPGGWRVSGAWSYASGSRHANWLGGLCPMREADGAALTEPDGQPMIRSFVFPKAVARIADDWRTLGLRGTGSDSYRVEDVFVPDAFCFLRSVPSEHPGTLYRVPLSHVYPMGFAGVALGLARAVQEAFVAMARGKTPRGGRALRDSAAIQSLIGHNAARLGAARAFLFGSLRDIWDALDAGAELSAAEAVTIRMATTFAIQESVAVVDAAYHEAGATAIHEGSPFARRFRDLHAVAQQVQARRANFELVGQALLGMPTGPLFI